MRRASLVIATIVAAISSVLHGSQSPEPVRAVFRIFDGTAEVSGETRVRVRASGSTDENEGIVLDGPSLKAELAPGIYDAQAIHHRKGRVLNVRWAERLVIVRYPDEGQEHLEVINFVPNFGALQLRLPPDTRADPSMVSIKDSGATDNDKLRVHAGGDYLLVVAPAGTYTFNLALPTGATTLSSVEIPGDRTRLRVLGTSGRP